MHSYPLSPLQLFLLFLHFALCSQLLLYYQLSIDYSIFIAHNSILNFAHHQLRRSFQNLLITYHIVELPYQLHQCSVTMVIYIYRHCENSGGSNQSDCAYHALYRDQTSCILCVNCQYLHLKYQQKQGYHQ